MLSLEQSLELLGKWKDQSLPVQIRFFGGPRSGFSAPLQGDFTGKLSLVSDAAVSVSVSGNSVTFDPRQCGMELAEPDDVPPMLLSGWREPVEAALHITFSTGELCWLLVFNPRIEHSHPY